MELRRLAPGLPSDLRLLEGILMGAPAYSWRIQHRAPTATDALEIMTLCPPGMGADDKFVLAIVVGDEVIGCADLVRGYPDAQTAYLGLLLLIAEWQGRGTGSRLVARLMEMAAGWGCTTMRLAVIETNEPALHFWSKHGFQMVSRKQIAGFTGDTLVMTCPLSLPLPGSH